VNSEKIWKIQKKSKLNNEKIWTLWKKSKSNSEKVGKIWKKSKLNSKNTQKNITQLPRYFSILLPFLEIPDK
jgi:hypothetical protein